MWSVLLGSPFNPSPYNARNQVYTRTYFAPGAPAPEIAATQGSLGLVYHGNGPDRQV